VKKAILLFLVVLLAGGGFYLWQTKKKRHDFSHYVPVKADKGDVVESVEATGVVKPSVGAEVTIGARMSGIVVKEPVQVGDRVRQGDLIAKIDDREPKASLEMAEASLRKIVEGYPKEIARLESTLERARIGVQEARASLKAAQSDAKTALWLCENKRRLFKTRSGSERDYRTACNEAVIKKAALAKAESALERAKKVQKEATLSLQKAKSDFRHDRASAEAKVRQEKIRLSYATISAPFSGIVTYVSTQEGETVVAGLNAPKFVKILDPAKIENRIYVDETAIGRIKTGMRVDFTVDSWPDRNFTGTISQIYPQPEIQNSVVYYIAVVKHFEGATLLRPEMTTHDTIIVDVKKGVLRLPNRAVKFKNGRFFVYLRRGREVVEQPVKTGISDSRYTQIVEGIEAGDTVLMEPLKDAD
jgi:RND family efflux transporter MFP subunit